MNSYRSHPSYNRSSEVTGTDVLLKANDDFLLTAFGDFQTITGADLVTQALLRRLHTPTNGYKRLVQTANGLEIIDGNYGNATYEYLSAASTPMNVAAVEAALKEAIAAEKRVELIDIKVAQDSSFTLIRAQIRYRILGETELRSLQLQVA